MKEIQERNHKFYAEQQEEASKDAEIFYNPVMINNRDLSEIAHKIFKQKVDQENYNTCDALSASGIRALRYLQNTKKITINDLNPKAVKKIKKTLKLNNIEINENIEITNKDANALLSQKKNQFNFIDIDPYGPFTPFVDSAARASNYNSMAAFTATDNAAPAGTYSKVCQRRYTSQPLKNSFMHETGMRIYIKKIFETYSKYDKAFEPKISFHERHYTRTIGRITESKKRTNKNLDNIGYLSFCPSCRWRKLEKTHKCPNCGEKPQYAGPLWTGKTTDRRYTEEMLENYPGDWESQKMLKTIHKEAEIKKPFYQLHDLCSNIGISVPKRKQVIEKIRNKGYPIQKSHFEPQAFKTNAPITQIKQTIETVLD